MVMRWQAGSKIKNVDKKEVELKSHNKKEIEFKYVYKLVVEQLT